MNDVLLVIKFKDGTKTFTLKEISKLIPYFNPGGKSGLRDMDTITSNFDNELELLEAIRKELKFRISSDRVTNICLSYKYKTMNGYLRTVIMPVKYRTDNFDIDHLIDIYAKYYRDNHARILANRDGIINVNHAAIRNYNIKDDNITDREIDLAVYAYFKSGNYKKYRDAYFTVKQAGYKVKTNVLNESHAIYDRTDLNKYSFDDSYMDSLRSYALTGEEEHDRVMEELSMFDLDDIRGHVKRDETALFDGTLSKEQLVDLVCQYRDQYSSGKKR